MSLRTRTTALTLAAFTLLGASACTNASAEGGGAASGPQSAGSGAASSSGVAAGVEVNEEARALLPEDVRERGTLTFASDPTYPPFEYMAADNKTLIGFDIDLTDAVAASLGLEPVHTAATFDTILPGLSSGKYDVGVSSFSITPERQKAVDFVPYLAGGTGLGVLTGNPKQLALEDNSLCGHAIAAQKGSIQALTQGPEFSKQCTQAGEKPIDIQTFPGQSDANLALLSGRVDGILSDSTSLVYQGQQSGGKFELAPGEDYEPTGVGLAVEKGSDLKPALDAAVRDLIESDAYDELYAQYGLGDHLKIDAAGFEKYSE